MIAALKYQLAHEVNRRLFPEVRNALSYLHIMDNLDPTEYEIHKNKVLIEQINYVYQYVPYYTNLFNEHNIKPSMIQNVEDLKIIPVLTKELVRQNSDQLVSKKISDYKVITRRSGGTTGEPIEAIVDKRCQAIETYSFLNGLEAMGYKTDWKMVLLWGGSIGLNKKKSLKTKLRSWALNNYLIPAFEINSYNAGHYLNQINSLGFSCLRGYASAIYSLACFKIDLGINVENVKLVITTSEQLEEEWKKTIKLAFNCDVKSYYGCSEIESLGYQIYEDGSYLIPNEVNIIENEQRTENLIITSLHNKAKPFIRYINGDRGIVKSNAKLDNRKDEIIELLGRSDDWLYLGNGEKISGRFGAKLISAADISVKKFQLIQHEIEHIEFRYDNNGIILSVNDKSKLSKAITHIFGDIIVTFQHSEQFILPKNKKFRITVCLCQ